MTATSSLDFTTNETNPPRPGVVLDKGCCASISEAEGDCRSVKVPPSGDKIAADGGARGLSSARGSEV